MQATELERIIRRILAEQGEGESLPPPPQAFDRILRTLEIRRGRRRLAFLARQVALVLAVALVFSATLAGLFPTRISEGGRKLLAAISHIITGHIHIDAADPPLLACFDAEALAEFSFLEDRLTFPVKLPAYVPPRYRATRVHLEGEVLTLYFTRGREGFVLIQGPGVAVPGPGGRRAGDGPDRQAVGFRDGEVGFLLMGDPGAGPLRKVLGSLR
jgi:hypothetical protein